MSKIHIYDIDGTVLDSMRMWDNLSSLYLESIGITPPDNLAEILDPMPYPNAIFYLADTFDIQGGVVAVTEGMDNVLRDQYDNKLELFDGMRAELEGLLDNGEELVAFSNTPHQFLDAALKRTGIYELFDEVFTVEDIEVSKDLPEAFEKVCDRLGIDPEDAIVHEDSQYAIDAAKEAGCEVIVYDRYR